MVPEQHLKKKIKSRLYYVSQFQNKHFTITSSRSSSFPRGDLRTRDKLGAAPLPHPCCSGYPCANRDLCWVGQD
ncbi:hypothetical protein KIL84_007746 [Mauremys mutica]|uniref:Uncharacterized protein n=1 Tax=Mauremys mutica TaxID=74926 RepID=A0A9D3X3P8_9SAUR|nr:hypothetical protein KIL84_007746 [Mauremys mutica]